MQKVLLCILDGLGLNPNPVANAFYHAKTPCLDNLLENSPNSTLVTCGERVGLPEGQMGNSEVGHLNIGAGRVVEQWLLRISNALKRGSLAESTDYNNFLKNVSGNIHLVGLYSDGGVHSHKDHLLLLLQQLKKDFTGKIFLHLFTDGRDTAPNSAKAQITELEKLASINTIVGRFYGMDRDKRWERTKRAYDLIAGGTPKVKQTPSEWIDYNYKQKITDEFIEPACFIDSPISPNDGVLFWNFREDRMRQIAQALCVSSFSGFDRERVPFSANRTLGFTEYDHSFKLPFIFPQLTIKNHLGEVLSSLGVKQLRTAETEKYPHVTYFFNGGVETAYQGEERILIPSPREVKTYDQKPEMSAFLVRDTVLKALEKDFQFILVNFANCDMVGHTGVFDAAVKAVETVDACLKSILEKAKQHGWITMIIADHGNAEQMVDYKTGDPFTSHTLFPVPIIIAGKDGIKIKEGGALCDVAPTILELIGVDKPEEMSGKSLIL